MNLEKLVIILKKNQKLYGKYDNDFVTYRDLIDTINELQYIEKKNSMKENWTLYQYVLKLKSKG